MTRLLRRHAAATKLLANLILVLNLCAFLPGDTTSQERDLHSWFLEKHGRERAYKDVQILELNKKRLVLAYWLKDGRPLQLTVDVFHCVESGAHFTASKVYSGGVAEEVRAAVAIEMTGDRKDELLFVRDSGQIQIVNVLEDRGNLLVEIFENGGSEITLTKSPGQIWIKSRSNETVEIYGWDQKAKKIVRKRQYSLVF